MERQVEDPKPAERRGPFLEPEGRFGSQRDPLVQDCRRQVEKRGGHQVEGRANSSAGRFCTAYMVVPLAEEMTCSETSGPVLSL